MHSLVSGIRMLVGSAALAALVATSATALVSPATTLAAKSCVRFNGAHFDARGDDNFMPQLNKEWVRVRNYCSTAQSMGGWSIHDRGTIHTFVFRPGTTIAPGATIKLHSGRGTNTAKNVFWQRSYGAVWNNDADTAYLVNNTGKTVSKLSQ